MLKMGNDEPFKIEIERSMTTTRKTEPLFRYRIAGDGQQHPCHILIEFGHPIHIPEATCAVKRFDLDLLLRKEGNNFGLICFNFIFDLGRLQKIDFIEADIKLIG